VPFVVTTVATDGSKDGDLRRRPAAGAISVPERQTVPERPAERGGGSEMRVATTGGRALRRRKRHVRSHRKVLMLKAKRSRISGVATTAFRRSGITPLELARSISWRKS